MSFKSSFSSFSPWLLKFSNSLSNSSIDGNVQLAPAYALARTGAGRFIFGGKGTLT